MTINAKAIRLRNNVSIIGIQVCRCTLSAEAENAHHSVDEACNTCECQETPQGYFCRSPCASVGIFDCLDEDTAEDDYTKRQV